MKVTDTYDSAPKRDDDFYEILSKLTAAPVIEEWQRLVDEQIQNGRAARRRSYSAASVLWAAACASKLDRHPPVRPEAQPEDYRAFLRRTEREGL